MAEIVIRQIEHTRTQWRFNVEVIEGTSRTVHAVTLEDVDYKKLTKGKCTPRECVDAAFRFLLEREDKESILSEFDVSVISKFFKEFSRAFPKYLPKKDA